MSDDLFFFFPSSAKKKRHQKFIPGFCRQILVCTPNQNIFAIPLSVMEPRTKTTIIFRPLSNIIHILRFHLGGMTTCLIQILVSWKIIEKFPRGHKNISSGCENRNRIF